jgi:hypothetical protein
MQLRWGRVRPLTSVICPVFEHVHDITDLPKPLRRALNYGRAKGKSGAAKHTYDHCRKVLRRTGESQMVEMCKRRLSSAAKWMPG